VQAALEQNPLYDRRFEHDACGLGLIARADGMRSREMVERALAMLAAMEHRGARGADPDTGDGAGLMLQVPDRLLRRFARAELELELPPPGHYAVAMCFLPNDPALRLRCEELCVRIAVEEGQQPLGWRDVPRDSTAIGRLARDSEPVMRQLLVAQGPTGDELAFRRKLTVIRRRVELAAAARRVPEATFHIASFSSSTLTYKGLLTARQLPAYYADLREPEIETAMALVHSRFSTNTLGSWDLAHPFHYLAHNGEINTVRGNTQWMHAREPQLRSAQLGDDLPKLFPLIDERWSDSAALDAAFELLVLAGRAPAHALAMLIPAAWSQATPMADDLRAFYEFHAGMLEPWDGPAAIAFCDGRQAGATLDRNGLRPCRYQVTRDGLLVLASEAGVLDLDPAEVVVNDRLRPGQMLIVDTDAGRIRGDEEIKRALARRRPYRALLDEQKIYLEDIPSPPVEPPAREALERDLRLFGYSDEELRDIVAPMARDGQEPLASMGVDTPLAALSRRPRLLRGFFKQLFAQVTNPAIDPQRETLVMSLRTAVGAQGNLLDESPDHARRLAMAQPVLTSGDLAKLRALPRDRFRTVTLDCTFDARGGGRALERALDALCRRASRAIALGEEILVLSDRSAGAPDAAPIPALLATAAVHSHLVREGWRTKCGLIVESGEPREVMDFALLVGFGAAAVNPYVALDLVAAQWAAGEIGSETAEGAQSRYVQAVGKGLLKVLSKMGVSTVMSYRGAQLFECVGLSADVVARYFTGTPSRVGGIGLEEIATDVLRRHEHALAGGELDPGGIYAYRLRGERHVWNPEVITALQRAVRDERPESYTAFANAADEENRLGGALRGLMGLVPAAEPLALDQVEPSSEIVKRFASGAMSLGSISKEAHETLAIALNRLGGRSNSGEGGEDARRSELDGNGDSRRSAIKQVASARFGVTTAYLVDADVLQIKVSQGAKPGEGGQLPGHKVDAEIARLRHSTPGVGLISPPPHHDIYSIEDLAQLIHDLRCVNPTAEISVKLVALAGIGTVAAGVAKAGADHIVIAGMDGGTGASPTSSIRHAGVPWELGLAETQQVLVGNALRGRVRLQVDGGLRTGRDVIIGALLGAEEFGFSTAPLVAAGCIMMRVCHLNTCPVGIATQDPELRRRFTGTPEHVLQYLLFVAEEVRELMAQLGVRRFEDLVGRTDLARQVGDGGAGIDLSALLATAVGPEEAASRFGGVPGEAPAAPLDREVLILAGDALARGEQLTLERQVHNTDRAIGALLSGEIVRRLGPAALADGQLTLRLRGTAGQSLGAWGMHGLVLDLEGQANDYVGKGLSGARIVVRPPAKAGYDPTSSIAVGNTTLYGATSGELYVRGRAGERFAVRNSGATAVVEGLGRHGCEYMTGGLVAVLGPVGRNFAAGMSGGVAYLWDPDGENARRVNSDMVALRPVGDDVQLRELVERHRELTGSDVAATLLADWDTAVTQFVEVMPHDLLRIAAERDPELEGARG
jgi:glutamate synthase (NADPH/NADH) large chain/glutamate synthase (ferredoxin)